MDYIKSEVPQWRATVLVCVTLLRGFLSLCVGFFSHKQQQDTKWASHKAKLYAKDTLFFYFYLSQWTLMLWLAVSNTFQPQIFAHSPSVHTGEAKAEYRMNSSNWVEKSPTLSVCLTVSRKTIEGSQNDWIVWKAQVSTSQNAILKILAGLLISHDKG